MRQHSWLAQLGVLVIHNDPVVEAELAGMAPSGVTVHAARFESPTSNGDEYTGTPWQEMTASPDVRRGIVQLGQMDLSAICLCFGSASFFGGREFDRGFSSAARKLAGGTEVFTAGEAIRGAMAALGMSRPLVVAPPWFTAPTFDATRGYLAEAGFGVADLLQYQLDSRWRGVRRHQLFDRGGRWEVDPEEVCRQVSERFPDDADGVLIPGSGFRSWEAVSHLESRLGVPVVTSNQACLWRLLTLTGVDVDVPGAGRLLSVRPAAV
ncbi:aspartate/glutamate racemase family protein [Streptomyces sodiiphilus]|uniref:Aspartate/glutamate racemase family protein n=1 Tax=Streptomyces sodiiphilus TaxID=226217 RepID=A0ABN2PAX2_9ACTN